MKNYRFYAEMDEERGSKLASMRWGAFTRSWLNWFANENGYVNCVAIPLDEKGDPLWQQPGMSMHRSDFMDAIAAVNDRSNAPVESFSVERGYLRKRCVRIDEALARRLHPRLFSYLEK